jgi:GT2 family glycosyltransferase
MPAFSIIIPTFNSEEFIVSCLGSIYSQPYRDFEVIVVDNGSKDKTVDLVKMKYPQTSVLENRENLGACKARNQGIERAKGDWIMALDCDTVLKEDFLINFSKVLERQPFDAAIVQPKILQGDRTTIFSCGLRLSGLRRFFDIGKDKRDNGDLNSLGDIFGACSACALYRRSMLEDIKEDTGYFDERFFFLVEDVDIAWRAQKKGYKALYCPELIAFHSGGSSGFDKKARQYLCFRNRYYSIAKNEGVSRYCRRVVPLLLYDLPRLIYLIFTNRYLFKKHLPYKSL